MGPLQLVGGGEFLIIDLLNSEDGRAWFSPNGDKYSDYRTN